MAMANHNTKWLYLMEPHTASRAIEKALPQVGGTRCGHHHINIHDITRRGRAEISNKKISDYKIIATVRNPFDTIVTRWKYAKSDLSFSEWVGKMFESETGLHPSNGLEETAGHIVYYEHLEEDLETTFGTPVKLDYDPNHKTQEKKEWQEYYQGESELVKRLTIHWFPYLMKYGYDVNPPADFEWSGPFYDDNGPAVEIKQDVRARMVKPI
jgi:hypothetical protein